VHAGPAHLSARASPSASTAAGTTLALIVVFAWCWPGLFGHDPWKPDEAYTVGLVQHIANGGGWIVPTLAGEPFMEKPPLFFATAALFARLTGSALPLHEAAHLATLFYVALALAFVYLTARRLFDHRAGVGAVLLLVASAGLAQPAHLLVTDNALVAGFAMGLYGLAIIERPAAAGFFLGTGAGIAFLSKGLIGPGLLGLTAVLLPIAAPWRTRAYAQSLAIAAVAFAPWALVWPLLLYRESPQLFHDWLVLNNFGRYSGAAKLGPEHDHLAYVKILPWFALPAVPLAAWRLWSALRRPGERGLARLALPFVSACVVFGLLSSACNQRYLYAVPLLVPLALLAADARDLPRWLDTLLARGAAVLAASAAVVLWVLWWITIRGEPAQIADALLAVRPGYQPHADPVLTSCAIVLSIAALVIFRARPTPFDVPLRWAAASALAWGLLMTLWLPYFDWGNSYRGVANEIAMRARKDATCIANRDLGEPQRAMLEYHAGLLTRPEGAPAAARCRLLLVQSQGLAAPQVGRGWKLSWHGSRPGDPTEHYWLFRSS